MRNLLLLLCIQFLSYTFYASTGEISSGSLNGNLIVTGTSSQLRLGLQSLPGVTYGKVKNKVVLKYLADRTFYLSENIAWNLDVKVQVRYFDSKGGLMYPTEEIVLQLNRASVTDQRVKDLDVLTQTGAYSMDLRILNVTSQNLPTPLPNNFSLEMFIEYESFYHNSNLLTSPLTIVSVPKSDNTIDFTWTGIAEEFDLEWAFVSSDVADLSILPHKPSDIPRFDFQRVTVKGNRYTLTNSYDNGFLYYRVRAVERRASNLTQRYEGVWNDLPTQRIQLNNTNSSKNWVYSATYSENGVRHETKSFIDGSLRSRQELVKLNSENVTLINEKFYDYEGRLVIETLPSPTQNLTSMMDYFPGLTNKTFDSGFSILTKKDFDISSDKCSITSGPMISPNRGAGYYFSTNNLLTKNATPYVSDAAGSPYTQIVYDNEGRPTKQAGAGLTHRLDSKHEVKLYYAQPTQKQLDKMFGNEVGTAEHYSMKAIQDPHGQLSFSYEDLSGRVIATSLVGESPKNMDSLDENTGAVIIEDNFNNLNTYSSSEEAYVIETDFFVQSTKTKYTFNYSMERNVYSSLCNLKDYNCVYDLEISIYDACGKPLVDGNTAEDCYTGTNPIFNKVITINSPTFTTENMDVYFPSIGKFKIRKVLRLNKAALDIATADFRATIPDSCVPSKESTKNSYTSNLDNDCGECSTTQEAQTDPNYCDNIRPNENKRKGGKKDCNSILDKLKQDMSPGGQYFDNIRANDDPFKDPTNDWLETNVNIIPPTTLFSKPNNEAVTWKDIRDNWKEEWSEQLVSYHPEYCQYTACGQTISSNVFSNQMRKWSEAERTSVSGNGCYLTNSATEISFTNDPFLSISIVGEKPSESTLATYLKNGDLVGSILDPLNRCLFEECKYKKIINPNGTPGEQVLTADEQWQLFVTKYDAKKEQLLDNLVKSKNGCEYLIDTLSIDMVSDSPGASNGFYIRVMDISSVLTQFEAAAGDVEKAKKIATTIKPGTNLVVNGDFESGNVGFTSDYCYRNHEDVVDGVSICSSSTTKRLQANKEYGVDYNKNLGDNYFRLQDYNVGYYYGVYGQNFNGYRFSNLFDHTFGGRELSSGSGYAQAKYPGKGYYLIADGATNKNSDGTYSKIWIQSTVPVTPGVKYDFSFYGIQIWSRGPKADIYNANTPILTSQISYQNDTQKIATHSFKVVYLNNGAKSSEDWTKISKEWICPPGVTSVELSIIDENPLNQGQDLGGGDDFALDDISFTPIDDQVDDSELYTDCICSDLKTMESMYASESPSTTTLNQYIADIYNAEFYANAPTPKLTATNIENFRSACVASQHPDMTDYPELVENICNFSFNVDCQSDAKSIGTYNADEAYNRLLEEKVNEFIAGYKKKCFSPKIGRDVGYWEDFNVKYSDRQYHYTLYYYDQAGNLVRTVPPSGVKLLNEAELAAVKSYRDKELNSTFIQNTHSLVSYYEYNSLNQIVRKSTPDADADANNLSNNVNGYTNYYWYDQIGRIVASQTSKQKSKIGYKAYSYVTYDAIGRVKQSGELTAATPPTPSILNASNFPENWSAETHQITETFYDNTYSPTVSNYFESEGQQNLRTRISAVTYDEEGDGTIDNASYYSYDPHGNVTTYISDRKDLSSLHTNGGIFQMNYQFDLVSGNVKAVSYQQGQIDQFYHRYFYDRDNRLTNVFTSRDGTIWDQDAKYFYYLHGPLARIELGEQKIQGIDYAYTLQGWMKGMNSSILNRSSDMGQDGYAASDSKLVVNKNVAADALGYVIGYNQNDYRPVGGSITGVNFRNDLSNSAIQTKFNSPDLYNGNIGQIALAMSKLNGTAEQIQLSSFTYDQLHRLRTSTIYQDRTSSSTLQNYGNVTNDGSFSMDIKYDPMGNILTLLRNTKKDALTNPSGAMDNLSYRYDWADPSSKTGLKSNRLYHVNDQVNSTEIGPDIKDMGTFDSQNLTTANFQYDADGNIISDKSEGIKEIKWNAIGKVTEINRDENFVSNIQPDIEFKYDGSGRRICKIVKPRIVSYVDPSQTILIGNWIYTYYIHDAKGNEIASYEAKMTESDAFEFILKEHDVYGSSRIATINENKRIATNTENILIKQTNRTLGNKHFELTNHLGSVINVITDRKIPIPDALNTTKVAFFQAQTISQADYYPFGMSINSRTSNLESYGFAYNGMKLDNEISGAGNSYTTLFRELDVRLGRWWAVDPLAHQAAGWTPYRFCFDNPISYTDPDGRFETRKEARAYKKANGISGRISKDVDGEGYSINDKKNSVSYSKGTQWEQDKGYTNDQGVIEASLVTANNSDSPNGGQAVANYLAYEMTYSSYLRNQYIQTSKNLDPSDVTGRTYLKQVTRELTPPITRSVIDYVRPSTASKSGSTSSANKTNPKANNIGGNMGVIGRGVFVITTANSLNNIVQAENKTSAIITESTTAVGGFTGAAMGAEVGMVVGAWFGGVGAVPGAFVGCIIGGFYGSLVGNGAGEEINELRK